MSKWHLCEPVHLAYSSEHVSKEKVASMFLTPLTHISPVPLAPWIKQTNFYNQTKLGTFLKIMPKKVQRSFQGEGTHKLPSPLTHISPVPLAYSSRIFYYLTHFPWGVSQSKAELSKWRCQEFLLSAKRCLQQITHTQNARLSHNVGYS